MIGILEWINQIEDNLYSICILSSFRRYYFRVNGEILQGFNGSFYIGDKVELDLKGGKVVKMGLFEAPVSLFKPDVATLSVLAEWSGVSV